MIKSFSLLIAYFLAFILPLHSWEMTFFRKSAPKDVNVRPIKPEVFSNTFIDRHLASSSFLKIYVDQALMILKHPSSDQKNLELQIVHFEDLVISSYSKSTSYTANDLFKDLVNLFDFDFDFAYKGISVTRSQMPHQLNYQALEDAVLTGFEARETLVSYCELHQNWSLLGHVSLLEKYTSKRRDLESFEQPFPQFDNQVMDTYSRAYEQTVKYGMGVRWKKDLSEDTKITIDAVMLHKTQGSWNIEELFFQDYNYSGAQFDSWKFSINFKF